MARSRSRKQPSPMERSNYCLLVVASLIAVRVLVGWPTLLPAMVVLVAGAWLARTPVLSGKKVVGSRTEPAPEGAVERYYHRMYTRMMVMRGLTPWVSVVPLRSSTLIALAAALAAVAAPVSSPLGYDAWFTAADAVAAFLTVVCVAHVLRTTASPEEPAPGVSLPATIDGLRKAGVLTRVRMTVPIVVGAVAGTWMGISSTSDMDTWRAVVGAVAGLLGGTGISWWLTWGMYCRSGWIARKVARVAWSAAWTSAQEKEHPFLTGLDTISPWVVNKFSVATGKDSGYYLKGGTQTSIAAAVEATVGEGNEVLTLPEPEVVANGVPNRSKASLSSFRVVVRPKTEEVDITSDETTEDQVVMAAECAIADWAGSSSQERIMVMGATRLTASAPHVWEVSFPPETDPSVSDVLAPLAGNVEGMRSTYVTESDSVLVGPLEDADWEDEAMIAQIDRLRVTSFWSSVWTEVLRSEATPTLQFKAINELACNGQTIHYVPFVSRKGVDVGKEYVSKVDPMRTALKSAPWLDLGFMGPENPKGRKPGSRSDKFFILAYSETPVPDLPQDINPDRRRRHASLYDSRTGPEIVLSGLVSSAFRAVFGHAKIPQVVKGECLTTSTPHIWKVSMALYGGLSNADIASKADRLKGHLRCPWLRVRTDVATGLTELYVGEQPSEAEVKESRRAEVAELDFEAAFASAKLVTAYRETPTMRSCEPLETNPKVTVYDFALPQGVSVRDVREPKALDQLRSATGYAFLQVVDIPNDPSTLRLLASRTNPIPDRANYSFDVADPMIASTGPGKNLRIPMGSGIDGSPVTWDISTTPHMLCLGMTGTGKTATLETAVYGALRAGWEVAFVDPSKKAADLVPFQSWMASMTGDLSESEAILRYVYGEVRKRVDLNAAHGATSIDDLPEDIRPSHVLIIIDEFTSLLLGEKVPSSSGVTDPEVLSNIEATKAANASRAAIASITGRIGREARSAGVHLLLGTQKLNAKTMEAIPGGDLKDNMGRLLLGAPGWSEMASGLKNPEAAPRLTHTPIGRGIFESMTRGAIEMQTWYASAETYAEHLADLPEREKWDIGQFMPKKSAASAYEVIKPDPVGSPEESIDLSSLDMSDLDLDDDSADADDEGEAAGDPDPEPTPEPDPLPEAPAEEPVSEQGASPLALGDLVPLPEAPVEPAPAAPLRAGGNQETEALAPDPGTIPRMPPAPNPGSFPSPWGVPSWVPDRF